MMNIKNSWKKVNAKKASALATLTVMYPSVMTFAAKYSGSGKIDGDVWGGKAAGEVRNWPWTNFLNSLMTELTGPLPLTLGIFGIIGAAIALFSGHGGDGAKKFIMLVFAISIALAAPTLMNYLSLDASTSGLLLP